MQNKSLPPPGQCHRQEMFSQEMLLEVVMNSIDKKQKEYPPTLLATA